MMPKLGPRATALTLTAGLILQSAAPAWPAVVRAGLSVRPAGGASVSGLAVGTPGSAAVAPAARSPSVSLTGTLRSFPAPTLRLSPSARLAPSPAESAPLAAPEKLSTRLDVLTRASAADAAALGKAEGTSAREGSARSFARLTGETLFAGGAADEAAPVPAKALGSLRGPAALKPAAAEVSYDQPAGPPAPGPEKRTVWTYLLGTGIFKIGMEALGLSAPLLALTLFGQVKIAAMLAVGWGLSQIVFGSLSGGLLDRHSPSRVLSWAMGLQSLTVAALIALFAADKFLPGLLGFPLVTPITLLALYSLAGGFMGAADTARQVIPPAIVGNKERLLKLFNAKTHMAYEIAGVAGALLTGVLIAKFGVISALILHPPAYLLAAFVFWKLKISPKLGMARAQVPKAPHDERGHDFLKGNPVSRAYRDIVAGAKAILKSPVFRWSTLALIIPLVVHRLLEGLLIPVAAKSLLGDPSAAAWIIGASNFGELLGAMLLMRAILSTDAEGKKRFRSSFWVRLMALGSLGVLALNLSTSLWIILPAVAFMSMTWAGSDLSLRSKLQNALPGHLRGRAFAFIGATAFAAVLGASLGIGFLMDLLPKMTVFYGLDAVFAAAAALLFAFSRRINGPKSGGDPSS